MKDALPIGLGYFAVSFSLGIAARAAGLTPFQGFLASLLNNASAGQYAGFSLIAMQASYIEIVLMTFVANARYLLMSCALSQRFSPDTSIWHRLLVGYDLTDEIFGITIAQKGYVKPLYVYGAILTAAPCWATGTALGIMAGNLLPLAITSALSVALFGMFLAIIIPPAKKDKTIAVLVTLSFLCSYLASKLNFVKHVSSGTITILLTVCISAAAAFIKPIPFEEKLDHDTE